MASEFELIARYFSHAYEGVWPTQGPGDDCAWIDPLGERLAVTTDMMALGTHFLPDADPVNVGHKALAVNLSDLAAAGAEPRAFLLALGLPEANTEWLSGFSRGLLDEAKTYGCALIGGDTTRTPQVNGIHAPVTISITAMGAVPPNGALTRSGASPGDDIWVSGTLGDAFVALGIRQGKIVPVAGTEGALFSRMDRPTPRVRLGLALRGVASACADISDGLAADLGHILERSHVGAVVEETRLPVSVALSHYPRSLVRQAQLTGGDDYELVFTAPQSARPTIEALSAQLALPLSRIGCVEPLTLGHNLSVETEAGERKPLSGGFDHFGD